MAQFKVVGLPDRKSDGKLNKTVKPIDRKDATIEAEKGETIWTNYNRNVDNLVELKAIGGKTHANGGTPMNPPSAGKEGESSSFIFSNNRKMIIKDPELLKYFGENGKGEKTPAEVSKKWLDALATAKAVLKDEHQDKIAKDSATLTMQNAAFNLSSLALWQESKKNFKDGMTDIFNPWFDKTKVTPEELLSVEPQHEQQVVNALQKAFGEPMGKAAFGGDPQHLEFEEEKTLEPQFLSLGGLKKFTDGGVPDWKGSDDDLKKYFNGNKDIAAQYQYIESLKDSPAFKKALFTEYKKAWDKDIHGKGYGDLAKQKKWKALDSEDAVVNNFIDMQKRNLALKAHGIDYGKIGQNATDGKNSSKYTNDFLKEKKLDDITLPGMDKTAQEQAAYIAFHELSRKQGTYADNKELEGVLSPFSAPKLGIADENVFGNKNVPLSRADGIYTDTTTGQVAGFNPPKVIEAKPEKVDVYNKGTVQHLPEPSPYNQPDGFRIQDENTMNRAFKAKRNIINIPEWQKASQFNLLEPQFDSPERKIAEANGLAANAIRTAGAFGSQASTQAAIQAANAQVYTQAANAIDENSKGNIGLFNANNQSNTQLANAKHQQDSQDATNLWAQHATRVQNFANAHAQADDKITEAINNAYTERSNRWNLNTNSTYEKIDPRTGKVYLANAKPLDGKQSADDDLATEFQSYKDRLPAGVDDKVILALMEGKRTGKFGVKDDGVLSPNELKAN